jgi:hypothetical protein
VHSLVTSDKWYSVLGSTHTVNLCSSVSNLYIPNCNIRRIFRKWDVGLWNGSSWLRIGTGGGQLWMRHWTFGFHKMRAILIVVFPCMLINTQLNSQLNALVLLLKHKVTLLYLCLWISCWVVSDTVTHHPATTQHITPKQLYDMHSFNELF